MLAQLGNRVQHALRAYTPDDAKALKATVGTFPTSGYDLGALLTSLGIGEAVVTVLSERGAPTPVVWTMLRAPQASMAPMPAEAMAAAVAASPLMARYGVEVDRESAYELLSARVGSGTVVPAGGADGPAAPSTAPRTAAADRGRVGDALASPAVRSFLRSAGSALGREITRGLFGTARRRR